MEITAKVFGGYHAGAGYDDVRLKAVLICSRRSVLTSDEHLPTPVRITENVRCVIAYH